MATKKNKELFDDDATATGGTGLPGQPVEIVLSVDEFLEGLNVVLREQEVLVRGEISQMSVHPTGIYLTLQDPQQKSVLKCYLYPGLYERLGFALEPGMEIKVAGHPRMYKPRGELSFQVKSVALAGEGSLRKAYEALKAKLQAEGLFERKRPLPQFIEHIGVITSRTGAVIDDFRKNLAPLGFKLHFYDVRVEGEPAVEQVAGALRYFNASSLPLDVLVLIRGGGGLEALQAFNNELVTRALFASRVPTIAGIGHDRDVPIASLVADAAVSTPTAAAALCSRSWEPLTAALPVLQHQLIGGLSSALSAQRARSRTSSHRLVSQFNALITRHRALAARLRDVFAQELAATKDRIAVAARLLESNDPERTLRLGYSIVTNSTGHVVKDAAQLKAGESVTAKLYKGSFKAKVERSEG